MRKLSWAFIAFVVFTVGVRAEILEQLLVKVNGEVLTKTELEQRQLRALRDRSDINPSASEDELKRAIAAITPEILVDIVDEMLLVQRGRELGQTMTDDQFKSILDNLKKDNNLTTDEQQLILRATAVNVRDRTITRRGQAAEETPDLERRKSHL